MSTDNIEISSEKGCPAKFEALLEKGEVLFFYKNHMDARLDNTLGEKTKGILRCCLFCSLNLAQI